MSLNKSEIGQNKNFKKYHVLTLHQRTYSITQGDYNLLSTHFLQNLPDDEKHTFYDAIHLFPTQADVEDHNHHYLESAHIPVLYCKARHSGGRCARLAAEDQADGLEAELLLAVRARVCQDMIFSNLYFDQFHAHLMNIFPFISQTFLL